MTCYNWSVPARSRPLHRVSLHGRASLILGSKQLTRMSRTARRRLFLWSNSSSRRRRRWHPRKRNPWRWRIWRGRRGWESCGTRVQEASCKKARIKVPLGITRPRILSRRSGKTLSQCIGLASGCRPLSHHCYWYELVDYEALCWVAAVYIRYRWFMQAYLI